MEHDGTHALVTGGGTGIGEGIARGLAEAGAQVTITGRRADVLAAVAASHPNLHALPMDVSESFRCEKGLQRRRGCAALSRYVLPMRGSPRVDPLPKCRLPIGVVS